MKIHRNALFVLVMVAMPAFAGGAGNTVGGQPAPAALRDAPNVTITGVARMSCQNNLKQLGLGVHTAATPQIVDAILAGR